MGFQPVQMNGNKFATGQVLKKPVEVAKGRSVAGWAQKSPEPCRPFVTDPEVVLFEKQPVGVEDPEYYRSCVGESREYTQTNKENPKDVNKWSSWSWKHQVLKRLS